MDNNYTNNETDDFMPIPDEIRPEYTVETDSETADEFGYRTEDYFPDYGETDEEAAVNDCADTSDRGCCGSSDCENGTDNSDCFDTDASDGVADEYDPADEQAATVDGGYDCECGTVNAQQHCKLDEYEIISDVLGSEKQLVKLYSTALCEAAEEPLRDLIRENIKSAASDQFDAFEYMQKRGMYKTEQAEDTDITEAKETFGPLCENSNCECYCGKNVKIECGCNNN